MKMLAQEQQRVEEEKTENGVSQELYKQCFKSTEIFKVTGNQSALKNDNKLPLQPSDCKVINRVFKDEKHWLKNNIYHTWKNNWDELSVEQFLIIQKEDS